MAAIRFGWLAGDTTLVAELNKLRLPYNINQLSQLTMEFALDNYSMFAQQAEKIRELRVALHDQLLLMEGVHPYPSQAKLYFI